MRSAAQAIFRNDGITAAGKRHFIAVRLFRCRADCRGRSIARPLPYNSLYERGKTTVPSLPPKPPLRSPQPPSPSPLPSPPQIHDVVKTTKPSTSPRKFPRRAAHPGGSSFPPFIDRRTKGNSFCPMENR